MHTHPPAAGWLVAGTLLLVLAVWHAVAVLRLADARPGERAWRPTPRSWWLLSLVVVNPLAPLTGVIVLAFVFKSVFDGQPAEVVAPT